MKKITFSILILIFIFSFNSTISGAITISHDTTLSGTINITEDVFLTNSATMTVTAGTSLLMSEGVSIKGERKCHIRLQGSAVSKVIVKSAVPQTYWGQLIVNGDSSSIEMTFADIMSGQTLGMDSSTILITDSYLHDYLKLPTKNLVYTHNAKYLHMNRCHISNYYQVNPFNTPILVENCLFEYINEDGIDCDNSPSAIIRNCTFRNGLCEKGKIHSVDAVDFGKYNMEGLGSIGSVENCFMYNITDKGVSAGEGCRSITVTGCVFYHCGSGGTYKDSSVAVANNNTIVSCEYGIECVQKNAGLGAGHVTGKNNILWNNGTSVYIDNDGTLSLSYSDISYNGIFPGTGNINAYPLFADTLQNNFQLLTGSPCIGTGYAGVDMGALFPVGGINAPTDYLNIGIPFSGEIINGDSAYNISWLAGDSILNVNLEFSSDNGNTWSMIAQNVNAKTGSYLWNVPNIYSSKCFVRVTNSANSTITSTQNLPFSITPVGTKPGLPQFSHDAGLYSNALLLNLSADPGATIFYTLDGSDPTDRSFTYNQPINLTQQYIDSNFSEVNITATTKPEFPLSYIRTAPVSQIGPNPTFWTPPTGRLNEIAVVKARCYKPGFGLGDVVTNSYMINQDGLLNTGSLPVISITTNKENFFDYYSGIYIPGYLFNGYSFTGNYEMSGSESERPIHFEYFDAGGNKIFSINAGTRVRGEWIRSLGQKALSIYAKSEYDTINEFNYEFFPGYQRAELHGLLKTFKRLILRNNGNEFSYTTTNTVFKDGMVQSLFEGLNFKYQADLSSIVFLNGEYWGIHNIRELPDEYSLGYTYNLNPDEIAIVEHNLDGFNKQKTGTADDFNDWMSLRAFVDQINPNDSAAYEYIKTKIDIENYTDYFISMVYSAKHNFLHNVGFWKKSGASFRPDAPIGRDGRWRWFAYDYDNAYLEVNYDAITDELAIDSASGSSFLLYKLLKIDKFKNHFINRYCDLLNSSFKPSHVTDRINKYKVELEPEIENNVKRWGTPYSKSWWETRVDTLISFANNRPLLVTNEMKTVFGLSSSAFLTVNVDDTAKGKVIVNTIRIDSHLPAVSASLYPWTGSYFKDFPMQLIATPEPGYRFVQWLETGSTIDTLSISLSGDSTFTALFETDPDWHPVTFPKIYFNEVVASNHTLVDNYGENPDWIELYNPTDSVVDLAGWYISDETEYTTKHKFVSSDSTKIPAHGFLLLYADNETDQGATHVSFKLDSGGDNLFLTASDGQTLIDSVSFGFQVSDTSYGRYPDGGPDWYFMSITTPGASNIHIDVPSIPGPGKLAVYPNPLINGIIHLSEPSSFHVYNELGEELLYLENATEANLSSFGKGIFFIRTDDGKTARIIKVN